MIEKEAGDRFHPWPAKLQQVARSASDRLPAAAADAKLQGEGTAGSSPSLRHGKHPAAVDVFASIVIKIAPWSVPLPRWLKQAVGLAHIGLDQSHWANRAGLAKERQLQCAVV